LSKRPSVADSGAFNRFDKLTSRRLVSLPNRLVSLPNRLVSLPNRLVSLPNRLVSLPNRLVSLPNHGHRSNVSAYFVDHFLKLEGDAEASNFKIRLPNREPFDFNQQADGFLSSCA
jgi:hypothetical protein